MAKIRQNITIKKITTSNTYRIAQIDAELSEWQTKWPQTNTKWGKTYTRCIVGDTKHSQITSVGLPGWVHWGQRQSDDCASASLMIHVCTSLYWIAANVHITEMQYKARKWCSAHACTAFKKTDVFAFQLLSVRLVQFVCVLHCGENGRWVYFILSLFPCERAPYSKKIYI